jgi:hypothetical protein
MSGSIRLSGVNGLPLSGSGLRYPGVYAALDFANNVYEVGGVSRRALTALSGFTFTRASLAMGYDATGKLTYGPNNLCLHSQALGTSPWGSQSAGAGSAPIVTNNYAVAPDGTMTATRVQVSLGGGTATGDQSYPVQGCTCPTARGSFYVKTNDGSTKTIYVRGQNAATKVVTGTWTRIDFDAGTLSATQFGIGLRGGQSPACSDSVDLLVWGAQLEAVTYQTTPSTYYPTTTAAYYGPRLVYDPVTLASQGILVEEARTNLLLQSQTLDNASWTKVSSTVTANAVTSPDGTTNADKIVSGAGVASCRVQQTVTVAGATVYTFSAFAKAAEWGWVAIRVAEDAAASVWFDIATGTLGTAETGWSGATITSVGNGWYRVEARYTTVGTSYTWRVIATNSNGNATTGDGTSGIYVWQAQLEAGTGASSPIPTTTAAVTRAADVAAVTGLAMSYPLSIVAEAYRGLDKATDEFWVQVDAGASTDRVVLQINSVDRIEVSMSSGGVGQGSSSVTTTVGVGANAKAAGRYGSNSILAAFNGALGTEDTTATAPATPSNLRIGSNQSGQGQPMYPISRIRIYNRALTAAQLQSLTS